MEFKDVQAFIEQNKDNDDVKSYLGELKKFTLDDVKSFLGNNEDGKKYLQSHTDSTVTKAIDTWKTNNLTKIIDDEVKKRFPEADPKDVKMKELEAKLENMQKETLRKELTNKGIKLATEKKIPLEIVDYLISSDEESTLRNINNIEQIFNKHVQTLVEERLKGGSHVPPGSNTNSNMDDLSKMSMEEYVKFRNKKNK